MSMDMSLVPVVIEQTSKGERSYDIFSRLLKERIIFLTGGINEQVSSIVSAQLLFLEATSLAKLTRRGRWALHRRSCSARLRTGSGVPYRWA